MKTDRELLELAAKAIDAICIASYDADDNFLCMVLLDGTEWNPLEDDGDALRLAVQLKMCVEVYKYDTSIDFADGGVYVFERHDQDPMSATRRAITRAAAQIQEEKEKDNA